MSAIPPIAAPTSLSFDPVITQIGVAPVAAPVQGPAFSDILTNGMKQVETKLATADDLVQRFALGESIPVHQVTYALEEARLSVELAMQVRTRLLEGYRELMNMQL